MLAMIDETLLFLTFPSEDPFKDLPKVRSFLSRIGFNVAPTGQFDIYYKEPLEKMFSRVVTYEYTKRILDIGLSRANQEVVDLVKAVHPKYVMWLSSFYELLPSTFDEIRKEGAVVVGWFFDDEIGFETYSKNWIDHLDYFVTNDERAVDKYRTLGAQAYFSLPCVGEGIEDFPQGERKARGVVFVGRRQPSRDPYFERWRELGLPLETIGPGWDSGPVSYDQMLEIFRTSKVNVNISVAYSSQLGVVKQLKARPFEVCLAGGFLLTDDAPGLGDCFEFGREVAVYSDDADLVEKCSYYLAHDDERDAIAVRGWEKARANFSSSKIIGGIVESIEADVETRKPTAIRNAESGEYKRGFSLCMLLWAAIFFVAGRRRLCVGALWLWISSHPFHALSVVPSILGRASGSRKK